MDGPRPDMDRLGLGDLKELVLRLLDENAQLRIDEERILVAEVPPGSRFKDTEGHRGLRGPGSVGAPHTEGPSRRLGELGPAG